MRRGFRRVGRWRGLVCTQVFELNPKQRAAIEELNQFDRQLYKFARTLHDESMRRIIEREGGFEVGS
jgi:hypothetical protein